MALTAALGTPNSAPGNIVLAYGAVVPAGHPNAFGALVFSDVASANKTTPIGVVVSASDTMHFSEQASVAPASQTVIGWVSPEQSTRFVPWPSPQLMQGGFYVTPNDLLGACVYNSTVLFDLVLSDEYDGQDLLLHLWWTSSNSGAWNGTVDVYIYAVTQSGSLWSISPAQPQTPHWHAGPVSFSYPSGAWTLCQTSVVVPAANAPFPLVAGRAYVIAFTVVPTGQPPASWGALPAPFLLLGAEVQNK
jgi:hypothetical protein